jgi:hypothetical protein
MVFPRVACLEDAKRAIEILASDVPHGYGPRPIPDPIDDLVSDLLTFYSRCSDDEASEMTGRLKQHHAFVLTGFAERMASVAVRDRNETVLEKGINALAIASELTSVKDSLLLLPLFADACCRLELDCQGLFDKLAEKGSPTFRRELQGFLSRSERDRSLAAMGYEASKDEDGFRYRRTW